MLSPLEGHWKVEISFPQTPNQCQSNHTWIELYHARSIVSIAVERRGLFTALTLNPVEREGHLYRTGGKYACMSAHLKYY